MKKILPFLLFLPLLIFVLLLTISQLDTNRSRRIVPTPTERTNLLTPTGIPSDIEGEEISQVNLTIISPESGVTVGDPSISVTGKTGNNINVVVNEQDLISNADGTFETSVLLDEGENYITIVAYDDLGNSAEREILVNRTVQGL